MPGGGQARYILLNPPSKEELRCHLRSNCVSPTPSTGANLEMRYYMLAFLLLTMTPSSSFGQERDCETKLTRLQQQILDAFPREVESIRAEISSDTSRLASYDVTHGDVVLAGMGLTLGQFDDPSKPNLLFYWPVEAPRSEWLDFDGPDGPYELVGWGYVPEQYPLEPDPPEMDCIPEASWFIHEAGWHLLDGDMVVTPDSRLEEPDRPADLDGRILYWHPAGWDLHLWIRDGAPAISVLNGAAPAGGLRLPEAAFWFPSAE